MTVKEKIRFMYNSFFELFLFCADIIISLFFILRQHGRGYDSTFDIIWQILFMGFLIYSIQRQITRTSENIYNKTVAMYQQSIENQGEI